MTHSPKEDVRRAPVVGLYLIIFLTSLTGFVREIVVAALFGVGRETDAFFFALGLTQTASDLAFSGSLSAAIIPLLQPMTLEKPWETLRDRARFVATSTVLVTGSALALAALLFVFMGPLIHILAPDMSAETFETTLLYSQAMVWILPFGALLTLFSLVLNAHHRFKLAASVFLGCNLVYIAIMAVGAPLFDGLALPMAAIAGPVLMVPLLVRRLRRMGLLVRSGFDFSASFFRSFFHLAGPSILSLGIGSAVGLLMTSHMLLRGEVAALGAGSISAAGYAARLYEAPVSILVNPAATLIFPAVVALLASSQTQAFAALCRKIFLWGLMVMVPVTVITYAGAKIVVSVILLRGSFDMQAMEATSACLQGFAPAVLAEAALIILFRLAYAMRKPLLPILASLVGLGALLALFRWSDAGSLIGVSLELSAALFVSVAWFLAALHRRFGAGIWPEAGAMLRFGLALAIAGLAGWGVDVALGAGLWQRAGALIVFAAVYTGAVAALMPVQRREALQAIHLRLREFKGDHGAAA